MPKKSDIAQKLSKSGASKSPEAKVSASVVEVKESAEPNKGGRPTVYSEEIVSSIMSRIASGESLVVICKDEDFPSRTTVMRWLQDDVHAGFRDNYARAREAQADFYAEAIIDIADEECTYIKHGDGDDGKEVEVAFDSAAVARNRLRVDARKWYASKLAPKKYGDKVAVGGADDLPPIKSSVNVTLTPTEAYLRMIGK